MNRYANSTIKGFLYQFEKTLNTILTTPDEESEITVEGIEDIDVNDTAGVQQLIQCKYHEQLEKFTLSNIEKPILQMLEHWGSSSQSSNISYVLFCYFPDKTRETLKLNKKDLENFIDKDTPTVLIKIKNNIRNIINQ